MANVTGAPVPRTSSDGITVFPGHIGTIYRAHNGHYIGRATPRLHRLLPDGRVVDPRALQRVRKGECGWMTVVRLLGEFGAPMLARTAPLDERLDYLKEWLPRLTRPLRHPGNLRYVWALNRRVSLPPPLPYPLAAWVWMPQRRVRAAGQRSGDRLNARGECDDGSV